MCGLGIIVKLKRYEIRYNVNSNKYVHTVLLVIAQVKMIVIIIN